MKKIMLLSLFTFVSCATAFSENPPQAVLAAFQQKFSNVKDVDWSKGKNGEWEAAFELANSQEMSANFSADGHWLETETEIAFSELPAPIRTALKVKKVKEAARIEKADGSTVYEAEVKNKDLIFDATGKRLN
ncbi:MAG: PepSY-like domain-containing protein [Chitinophagales bacterium]|nr:PepSY-like domain-containing protein [Chitinophagales bacterium]